MSVSKRASATLNARAVRGAPAVAAAILAALSCLPAQAQPASPTAPVSPASPSGTTKGYVFTAFWYSMYEGDDACPGGKRADGAREYMTPKMPASTAARLGPDEYKTYITDVANWGRDPKGLIPRGDEPTGASAFRANAAGLIDQCTHPGEFRDPPHYTVQGHVAYGMNLDGTDGTGAPAPTPARTRNSSARPASAISTISSTAFSAAPIPTGIPAPTAPISPTIIS